MSAGLQQFPDDEDVARRVARAEEIIGYEFKDKSLLVKALTHPSAVEEERVALSYERLEFLGDAFLGGIVALEVYQRYPDMNEGGMTRLKSSVVSGATLSHIMEDLGFADLIIFGESERGTHGRGMHSALENIYESIVAAIALDGGIEVARSWVLETVGPHIDRSMAAHPPNPKSQLQEILQEHGNAPEYRVIGEDGPPHDRVFTVEALCNGKVIGRGSGRSKKEAEANAAQNAIDTHSKAHNG
ncbi:MAG: ribonuclease III [Coriobacteriales bacterium]|jgi:ribonuclease-3